MSLQSEEWCVSREDRTRLSICIPTFNRADILYKTLEHLHQVCDDDVEIVVADNTSPDQTQMDVYGSST